MKKNLALVLSIVMLLGSLFGVMSMAEATEETTPPVEETPVVEYAPKIAYSNVSYTDKMYVSFAVNAPAQLAEGESVKLILWSSIDSVDTFSYKSEKKLVIDAEAELAKIGEADYLVFKYDALTAADLANAIYARPVVVSADKATAYGSVVEYSVLEYISAAKGEFEGIAGLEDPEYIGVLDSMIEFGALAQKYLLEDAPEFFVNEKLSKIFMTPSLVGVAKDKTFAGFFKYEEDGFITLTFPHFDGYEVVSVSDKDGAAVVDADPDTAGFQIASVDADVELGVAYKNIAITTLVADNYGADFNFNTVDGYTGSSTNFAQGASAKDGTHSLNGVKQITWNNSSISYTHGGEKADGSNKNWRRYHGFKTVADPENEGQLVFQWTASDYGGFTHAQFSENNLRAAGIDDTIGAVITFEMELGGHNGKVANVGSLYHRLRVSKYYDNNADGTPQLDESGNPKISTTKIDIDTHACRVSGGVLQIYIGDKVYADVGVIPVDGMRKFAVSLDYDAEMIYGYAEDENGVMQLTASGPLFCAKYAANAAKLGFDGMKSLILPSTAEGVISFSNGWTFTGSSNWGDGDNALVDLDGDGEATDKVMDGYVNNPTSYWALVDGKLTAFSASKHTADQRVSPNYNLKAVQMYAETNCGLLVDNYYLVVGNPYN